MSPAKANYGIDAPGVVVALIMAAVVLTLMGVFIGSGTGTAVAGIGPWIGALLCGLAAAYLLYGSKAGKPALWRRTLDDLGMAGDEQVLDVGCGRGLVLIEMAKRLPNGRAHGVDIWRNRDQSGNSRVTTELNARLEQVADRVEVTDADMTRLPFDDDRFDVVTASLAIHNIALAADRARAVQEMMRVVRPGGRIVILDIARTEAYEDELRRGGFEAITRSDRTLAIYPPARVLTATKPA